MGSGSGGWGAAARMGHLSNVSAVPIDDDHEEGSELGPPPPADDRLWRHPSEMGGAMPVRIVTARPSRRRSVTIGVVSGLVGAAAMLAVLMAVGALEHRRTTVAVEQVKQPLSATSDSQVAAVTAKVLPALARVDALRHRRHDQRQRRRLPQRRLPADHRRRGGRRHAA